MHRRGRVTAEFRDDPRDGRLSIAVRKEAGYPADFATAYAANVASKEDKVKAVVTKIELGEGTPGSSMSPTPRRPSRWPPSMCRMARTSPRAMPGWS